MSIKAFLKKNNFLYNLHSRHANRRRQALQRKLGDEGVTRVRWKQIFGKEIDLENPKTLNEKIQWLKLHDRKSIYVVWADKFACRDYIREHFGEEYLVPLILKTDKPSEINKENIGEFPCVIKTNHSSGQICLVRSPSAINWKHLRRNCKTWLKTDYYAYSQEWQYKDIKRYIVVEKMLLDKKGRIPNDFKLHFIEGQLVFIYCSVDREGKNYRQIYDVDWHILPFRWDAEAEPQTNFVPIEKPKTLEKMIEIGSHFAKQMHYVRVDFYDVDGKLYCGEITLHHGSGYDKFSPEEYDLRYGNLVKLDTNPSTEE